MLEQLLSLDTQLFIYLNGLGSSTYDWLWLRITRQLNWTPLFLVLLYLMLKKLGIKQTLYLLLAIAVLITFSDQVTNLFKNGFQRLRPCNNPVIKDSIRIVQSRSSYSFFSGHAATSMAVSVFIYHNIKHYFKYAYVLFLWSLVFAYSRIYLGLHYPVDILTGYLFGATSGCLAFWLFQNLQKKYFPKAVSKHNGNPVN
ncbi:phosphatase PAP2 family protein [Flavobacterium crassostreae]|uniref:Phosphoesterase n=1 Tax=Flavobacterium crassostreae TaxID=1763534 RepID=A0A1B9DXP9_9FLAO|nr:phosphatase PAP2 family protein [Flavobacterium crassostreae]OCB74464.1 phosphoesterase [Flavobacterium crassostreae]